MESYKKLHTSPNVTNKFIHLHENKDFHNIPITSSSTFGLNTIQNQPELYLEHHQSNSSNHDMLSLSKDLSYGSSNDSDQAKSNKKIRKRRTLSETNKRDFRCGCGKNYVSYPAIYLHIQRKHNSIAPSNTIIPEKPEAKDKVKRGRPKV